ncbi:MAG TPA: sigma factor-like helix-turn-helix DNA-binding protein [Byssovorax sp.]|jgi:DNA-directed RNA polymerase specialized sigma24 family protein
MRRAADPRARRLVLAADLGAVEATRSPWSSSAEVPLAGPLRAAIERDLTDKQREVVEAYFFDGESEGAIARRLGVTQQVVHKRIFGDVRGDKVVGGAIARLRRSLEAEGVASLGRGERP